MSTVIKVENLSKYYRLGLIGGGTLREDVNRWIAKMKGLPDPLLKVDETHRKDGEIWALKDINLEVKEGEILGIIGRNGAGKSTLLKILSRITAPTRGQIKIKGRVGSLLEVGTGFHPELTGRENIYLNGAILGMNRAEVTRKLEEIIDFAGVEKFVDTPVKRYSSGMTVRLAFAVAAHLEPEILIIDEVLAVGDAAFQKKCLGKMEEISGHGRTILFVSHNLGSIKSLCSRGLLLENGQIVLDSDVAATTNYYLGGQTESGSTVTTVTSSMRIKGNQLVTLVNSRISDCSGKPKTSFLIKENIQLEVELNSNTSDKIYFWLFITNMDSQHVVSSHQGDKEWVEIEKGRYRLLVKTQEIGLMPDTYRISMGVFTHGRTFLDWIDGLHTFRVETAFKNGQQYDHRYGLVDQKAIWHLEKVS